ncbi:MAG: hypothetical protein H0W18_13825 [Acidobacteria bacterium]|nr:hypothetical protein [Acidobacteriota bacterium]
MRGWRNLLQHAGIDAGARTSDRERVNGREVAARETLVRFRDRVRPADLADLRARADGERIDQIGRTGVLRVRSRSMNAAALVAQLSRRPDVLYAEPNYIVRASGGNVLRAR